jgi:hypothetical protein
MASITEIFDTANRDQFYYTQTIAIAATGAATVDKYQPPTIAVDKDADFVWQNAMLYAGGVRADTLVQPAILFTVKDESTGRDLMSEPIPLCAWFGWGAYPIALLEPYQFMRGGGITFTLYNQDTAQALSLALVLSGTKLFA